MRGAYNIFFSRVGKSTVNANMVRNIIITYYRIFLIIMFFLLILLSIFGESILVAFNYIKTTLVHTLYWVSI